MSWQRMYYEQEVSDDESLSTKVTLELVCQHYGVKAAVLLGKSRLRNAVRARQAAYYILRTNFNYSYPEIGLAMSRDSSTPIAGCRRMKTRMEEDAALRSEVHSLSRSVQRVFNSQTLGDMGGIPFSASVRKRLEELLETGLYGRDLGDVIERLVCQQLQGLKNK